MVGALGVWTPREAHHPGAQDDLSSPLPFGQSDNDWQSNDKGSQLLDLGEDAQWLVVSSFGTQESENLECRGVKDPELAKYEILKRL
jgi:hypothetical protein